MRTVLIIEDDLNLREGLELLFKIEGYETLGVSNGRTALNLIRNRQPDVVLTNFQMPGADGLEVLRAIRTDGEIASTPIVFLTANHRPSIREQAVRDGADAFLTKPFNLEELVSTVEELASGARHEQSM